MIEKTTSSGDIYYVGENDAETAKIVEFQKLVGATPDGKLGIETVGKFNGLVADQGQSYAVSDVAKNLDGAIAMLKELKGNWFSRHPIATVLGGAFAIIGLGMWIFREDDER